MVRRLACGLGLRCPQASDVSAGARGERAHSGPAGNRTDLSIIAIVGIILLIGIVKKNAIMMIDFALAAERNEGKSSYDSIVEACLLRFRPILMTTMAALLGALPLALGSGTGSELRRPLGITIIGGLIMSQLLTLYTTPVVYLYFDSLQRWWDGDRKTDDRFVRATVPSGD